MIRDRKIRQAERLGVTNARKIADIGPLALDGAIDIAREANETGVFDDLNEYIRLLFAKELPRFKFPGPSGPRK